MDLHNHPHLATERMLGQIRQQLEHHRASLKSDLNHELGLIRAQRTSEQTRALLEAECRARFAAPLTYLDRVLAVSPRTTHSLTQTFLQTSQ